MDLEQIVRRRRMIRNYTGEPVERERIRRVVALARRAPSAGFAQGQSFVVVTEPEIRGRLAELAGEPAYVARGFRPWISRAPVVVVVCADAGAYRDRYREPDKLGPGAEPSWPVPWWFVDAGCSLMLLLLAAVEEGLATGFLGIRNRDGVRALLGIPGGVEVVGLVTIGHPAPDRPSRSLARGWRPEGDVVHWERWGDGTTDRASLAPEEGRRAHR